MQDSVPSCATTIFFTVRHSTLELLRLNCCLRWNLFSPRYYLI